ncbi:hypothetical protein CYMTET_11286 [Cymbomonas tetramitiformis]|uniref:Uncharacterized protein n=2 Tax=Cymbomonas tetramitiformis TaxID=36881 RepID=A0AAE0GMK6_9CHLO|nr:hypothetical protein CYMTET_11286 [Cymbomonas tetramitiformis]
MDLAWTLHGPRMDPWVEHRDGLHGEAMRDLAWTLWTPAWTEGAPEIGRGGDAWTPHGPVSGTPEIDCAEGDGVDLAWTRAGVAHPRWAAQKPFPPSPRSPHACDLLDFDKDKPELCYEVVEGVPGGTDVNIAKGGNIPKDVVEVLLKFGVKPSPHDEKGKAGDHHDRILAMHEESIGKLLALPSNSDKKIKEKGLQHDATSILEEELLVWPWRAEGGGGGVDDHDEGGSNAKEGDEDEKADEEKEEVSGSGSASASGSDIQDD